jgi:hypothetical protein
MLRAFSRTTAAALLALCGACGTGTPKAQAPMDNPAQPPAQAQLELAGARLVLDSYPYLNRMPTVVDASGQRRCENFIVTATLRSAGGAALPAGLALRKVVLGVGGQAAWRADLVAEQPQQPGGSELAAVARGCPNAQTKAGQPVRVSVEVQHAGRSHWIYHDTRIEQVF